MYYDGAGMANVVEDVLIFLLFSLLDASQHSHRFFLYFIIIEYGEYCRAHIWEFGNCFIHMPTYWSTSATLPCRVGTKQKYWKVLRGPLCIAHNYHMQHVLQVKEIIFLKNSTLFPLGPPELRVWLRYQRRLLGRRLFT